MIENIRVSVISNSNTLNDNAKSATRVKIKTGLDRNCIQNRIRYIPYRCLWIKMNSIDFNSNNILCNSYASKH